MGKCREEASYYSPRGNSPGTLRGGAILPTPVTVAVGHAFYVRDTVNVQILDLSRVVGVGQILHCDDRATLETAVFVLALEHAHLAHAAALVARADLGGVTQAHDLAGLHLVVLWLFGVVLADAHMRTCARAPLKNAIKSGQMREKLLIFRALAPIHLDLQIVCVRMSRPCSFKLQVRFVVYIIHNHPWPVAFRTYRQPYYSNILHQSF
eukprot:COSAG06_NODE_3770_length_4925_cov_6.893286_5_plen_209_part_00